MTKAKTSKKATVETTLKAAAETVKETVEKTVKEATINLDNVAEFSKANYEALVASGNAAVKVAQKTNADFIENSKNVIEKNVADVKTLFSAKTPAEFFELQAGMFKARYDEFIAESARTNENLSNTAGEVTEPLKARYEEVAAQYNFPVAR
ncbi:MAG: phasin family protein [Emcibacter sp.]|nr:phasin family protein [Emcibacter sp.]